MKIRLSYLTIAVAAIFACAAAAPAAPPAKKGGATTKAKAKPKAKAKVVAKPVAKKIGAENGLAGIKLYQTGLVLITKFGSPNDIQAVTLGGGAAGPGGAGPGGAGPGGAGSAPMGGGARAPGGARGGGAGTSVAEPTGPMDFGFGDSASNFQVAPAGTNPNAGGPGGPSAPMGAGVPGGGTAPGGPGGASGGDSGRVVFTRWIYKRGGSRYGFILNKFNEIVQIEAVGLADSKVRTARGIGFGASFGTIIRKYGAPDAYEINGNNLVLRYLVRHKVAFRLSRLGMDKPHVVTGVVVAAGKS